MPQRSGAPTAFAAAGAPKEEVDAQPERPAPSRHSNDLSVDEHRLVLPDDVPMKVGEKWRGPFRRRAGFEAHLGLGTPVGAAGLMFEYGLLPEFSVAVGAGVGSGPAKNILHGAIAARVRPAVTPTDHDAMVLEAAFSTGGYQRFELGPPIPPVDGSGTPTPVGPSASWAHFLQFEAAWEHRSDKGFLLRLGGGVAGMLNPGALQCVGGSSSVNCAPLNRDGPELVAVLDFAVGQSF